MSDELSIVAVESLEINGKQVPAVTSLQVAKAFGKEHFHVMRDIKEIIPKCSESFNESNFGLVDYMDAKGEKRPVNAYHVDAISILYTRLLKDSNMMGKYRKA